ncbi:FtsX-like permease family protein [Streptomyces sp. NPDC058417]|uniref:FtsX-like permease family protein n=2 Tax=Streptomyces TaxID=1883 RepID=UPI00365F848E
MKTSWRGTVLGSQIAEFLRRPGRSAATALSLTIAAAVVFGTVVVQQIIGATTAENFRGTAEATSLVVTAPDRSDGVADGSVAELGRLPGVAEAVGQVRNGMPLGGSAVERWLRLSSDPGAGPLSQVRVREGVFPAGRGGVAVGEEAARRYRIAVGSTLVLLRPDADEAERTEEVRVRVSGVVRGEATDDREPTAYASGPELLRLLGVRGYERVDVRADAGTDLAALADRVRAALPGAEVRDADDVRAEETRQAVAAASDSLDLVSVFLVIAVGAAALVAASTFRIVFAQRQEQLALLRAVGAEPRRLRWALVVEGAAVGLVAGLAGVLAAGGAGLLAPPVAARLGHTLYLPGRFSLTGAALTVLGTSVLAVLAVLAPALTASRVSPLQALRAAALSGDGAALGRGRTVAGVVCALGAAVIAWQRVRGLPQPGDVGYDGFAALELVVVSAVLAFLALVAFGPLLVRPLLAVVAVALRRAGAASRLASAGVGGAPRRAAGVSVVVALGVSLLGSALIGLASLDAYDRDRQAVATPFAFSVSGRDDGPLPTALVAGLRDERALTDVTGVRTAEAVDGPRSVSVTDLDLRTLRQGVRLAPVSGSLDRVKPGRVVVAAEHARTLGVEAGDAVTVRLGGQTLRLTVAAVLRGEGPYGADLFVTPADLTRAGVAAAPTMIVANVADDSPGGYARAERAVTSVVEGRAQGAEPAVVRSARESGGGTEDLEEFGVTVNLMLCLTLAIAVVGVSVTASLTVVERRREFGLLRALGLSSGGVRRMVTLESALHGALGGALGLLLGLPYGWLAVRVVQPEAPFSVPWGGLAAVLAGLLLLTAASAALPALRASRTPPVAAITQAA